MNSAAILYSRVSTDDQAESGLGLADQATKLRAWATMKDADNTIEIIDDGISAKSLKRPGLGQALEMLAAGDAGVLVVTKLDRLTRNVQDLGALMDRAETEGWALVINDLGIDTTTSNGKLVANVLASVAQWERQAIGERTKAALAEKKAQGARLGRPTEIAESIRQRIAEDRHLGLSMGKIAQRLNAENVPTARGGKWHASTISAVLKSVELDQEAAEASVAGR